MFYVLTNFLKVILKGNNSAFWWNKQPFSLFWVVRCSVWKVKPFGYNVWNFWLERMWLWGLQFLTNVCEGYFSSFSQKIFLPGFVLIFPTKIFVFVKLEKLDDTIFSSLCNLFQTLWKFPHKTPLSVSWSFLLGKRFLACSLITLYKYFQFICFLVPLLHVPRNSSDGVAFKVSRVCKSSCFGERWIQHRQTVCGFIDVILRWRNKNKLLFWEEIESWSKWNARTG